MESNPDLQRLLYGLSKLVIRRLPGQVPLKTRVAATGPLIYRTPEPPLQIFLDGIKIGTIRWHGILIYQPTSPKEKMLSYYSITPGHHNLTVGVNTLLAKLYAWQYIPSHTQSFEIALGETVTFICQYIVPGFIGGGGEPSILLEKQ